ncbi:MAG: riboflavin biosynthesis protein RibF [Polyangiaceae bacterium]
MSQAAQALVVIGNFDGVHRGHQAVIHAVARLAKQRELTPKLMTFEPHPAVTLGRVPPPLLTTIARKRELVRRHCPNLDVVVRAFTPEFAAQSPEQFARTVLYQELGAKLVMVGYNFRFGRGRSGGFDALERFGVDLGFDAIAEPLVCDDRGAWSSTRVRGLIAAGEMDKASEMLGRPHMVSGQVVRGHQRGRTIGFPTCNLAGVMEVLPPFGVYAVVVDVRRESDWRALGKGVANIGLRPTVATGVSSPLVEVHLFGIDEDLYDAELRVHLVSRLRDERQFAGLDELRVQIEADGERAQQLLVDAVPDPDLEGVWY